MKVILTTDGLETQVCDEDYDYLNQFSWSTDGHSVCRMTSGKKSRMHIEIGLRMGLQFKLIDHKDRNWKNNQRDNLRAADKSTNNMNRGPTRKNLYSSYKGVFWSHQRKKWRAQIQKQKRQWTIGHYDSEDEAALAYNNAAMVLFGEFAFLNILE